MAKSEGISLANLKVLVERAGLKLATAELEALKPVYDLHAKQLGLIHSLALGEEESAVTYTPNWDPPRAG
jgi:hypothetical protein